MATIAQISASAGDVNDITMAWATVLALKPIGMFYSILFSTIEASSRSLTTDFECLLSEYGRTDDPVYSEESIDPVRHRSVICLFWV